jgi:hypothetical protein
VTAQTRKKLNRAIESPHVLDLAPHCVQDVDRETQYRLTRREFDGVIPGQYLRLVCAVDLLHKRKYIGRYKAWNRSDLPIEKVRAVRRTFDRGSGHCGTPNVAGDPHKAQLARL